SDADGKVGEIYGKWSARIRQLQKEDLNKALEEGQKLQARNGAPAEAKALVKEIQTAIAQKKIRDRFLAEMAEGEKGETQSFVKALETLRGKDAEVLKKQDREKLLSSLEPPALPRIKKKSNLLKKEPFPPPLSKHIKSDPTTKKLPSTQKEIDRR